MNGKPLGVSEVRGQRGSNDGSNHVDTEIAGVKSCGHGSRWQRGSKHVDTGVAGVK